jgi:hypothetical protein
MMKPINVEITMGHDLGISSSYYKPTEREVLDDYIKAIPLLTINGNNYLLEKQELTEKTNHMTGTVTLFFSSLYSDRAFIVNYSPLLIWSSRR